MIEVEAKARISKSQLVGIRKHLKSSAKPMGPFVRKDTYFGEPKKSYTVRTRQEKNTKVLTIKHKKIHGKTEENIELTWPIKNPKTINKLLLKSGFPAFFRKHKKSETYEKNNCLIEINTLVGLGTYLEIEKLVAKKSDVQKAKNAISSLFKEMGINKNQLEPRSYMELLL